MSVKVFELPLDVELLPTKTLTAGNITCVYEKGNLRYIRNNDVELLRMVYVAVRDENWATAPYEIQNEVIDQQDRAFKITYTAVYTFGVKVYRANVSIVGGANNEISFSFEGEALNDFLSNRIGICVLHPLNECCGNDVAITQPDGAKTNHVFPGLVGPHQPFINIGAMEWVADGVGIHLKFDGDIFETEDQRNWTDGSFKTYSTPLSDPFPVSVRAGDKKQQQVTLRISDVEATTVGPAVIPNRREASREGSAEKQIRKPFPKIGFSRPSTHEKFTTEEINHLKQIPFDHYLVTIHTKENNWLTQWNNALSEAEDLNATIVAVIMYGNVNELNDVLPHLTNLHSVLLLDESGDFTDESVIDRYANEIKSHHPSVLIEFGSAGHYAELNRNWPTGNNIGTVSFPMNPQAHAVDFRTMVDNLDSHADLIKTIQTFAPAKHIRVGPISFDNSNNRLHKTNFAAWWILAAIAKLSPADAITICPAIGEHGLFHRVNDTSYECSPLYVSLVELKAFNPKWIINSQKNGFDSELIVENDSMQQLVFRLKYS